MLKTLPSILTAPAQAATAALSGKTAHLDAQAGTGFALLMQQHAAPAPARPADNRPNPDNAKPPSVAASPAPSTDLAGKRRAEGAQDNAPPRPAERSAEGAGAATQDDHASASPSAGKPADSRSPASQTTPNHQARARQAAPAGRSSAADGASAQAGRTAPGGTPDDSQALPDPINARGPDDPVPAPDNATAAALPNPASVPLLAADPVATQLLAKAADGAGRVTAGNADGLSPRGTAAESTASWVAAQQRQRDSGGSAADDRGAARIATDPDDASGRMRRPAGPVRAGASGTPAEGPASAAAWAARLAAERTPTGGAALPASPALSASGSAGRAGVRPDAAAVPIERAAPRLAGSSDATDPGIGALAAGGVAAAGPTRSGPGFDGGPASTAALATRAVALGAAVPGTSTPADALPTSGVAPQPGVLAGLTDDSASNLSGQAQAQRAADSSSLAAAIGPDSAGTLGSSPKPTPQAGTAAGTGATDRRTDDTAAATSVLTPAQAASAVGVSGADRPSGPSRTASLDRAAASPAISTLPDAASRDSADRDTRQVDRLGGARLHATAPTSPTALAPNTTAAQQTPDGADEQARAMGGDIRGASAVPVAFGVNTGQAATATVGLANTPTAAATAEARIAVPVDSPGFAPALGAQLSLFAQDGVQTARLQINPAEMGPITVQIALDGNTARVDFQADRAATRDLIEASLPALAGAMQDAGLTLTGGGVFQQHPGRQPPPEHSPTANALRNPAPDSRPDSGAADPAFAGRRGTQRGLVDLVA